MDLFIADWSERAYALGPHFAAGLGTLLVFWLAGSVIRRLLLRLARETEPDRRDALNLLGKTLKVTLVAVGIVSALGTWGVNVAAMVAGLGLTGFALGFALKDALSNLLAGVLVLIYRPFKPGDRIAVSGFEGQVASIDLRYTTLISEEAKVLIPNATLFTNSIKVIETTKGT
jgi:small conductance mechanosensitive channel